MFLCWYLLSAFYIPVPLCSQFTPMGLKHLCLHYYNPLKHAHGRQMCLLIFFFWPMLGLHQVATSYTVWSSGASCHSNCCPPAIHATWWGIQLLQLIGHLISLSSINIGEESSFPGSIPPKAQPTLNHWWELNMVIGYQVNTFYSDIVSRTFSSGSWASCLL